MPLPSFSRARWFGLCALWLGVVVGCGGGGSEPPPTPEVAPDASRSSVAVDRASGVRADGSDRVTITVTARDAAGKALSGRTVHVEVSGAGNTVTQPAGTTSASGVVTASVVSSQAGSKQVTASVEAEGGAVGLAEQPGIAFVAPPAVKLAFLSTNLSATAGEAVSPEVEVAIQDGLGRTMTGASAEVSLLLAAGPASAGLEGTLTAQAVGGVARFPRVVLKQAGAGYKLKATSSGLADAISPTFEVVPALPTLLVLSLPGSTVAGSAVSAGVTIRDAFGNVATNYRGTVRFSSPCPGAVLPPDAVFTEADQGTKAFSLTLSRAGSWDVQVVDIATPTLVTSSSLRVLPGPATQFVLTSLPGPFEAGEEFSVEVMAKDAFGNEATGYVGTIHVTATDPAAELPGDYLFTETDAGRHSFNVVLKTAAALQQLTVTDTAVATLTATLGREIIPAAPSQLRFVVQPGGGAAHAMLPAVQVGLADAFGNPARVTAPPVTVSLKGGNAAAVLTGTLTVNPVDGLATFSDLSVDQAGNGFQLTARAGVLPAVDSASFNITSMLDACSGVVCEVPVPTCAADGVTRVTFQSACVLVDDLPSCRDSETRSTCTGLDAICFAAACGTASRPQAGELTLTELMHSPSPNTTPYFEIHNPTSKLLNIVGLQIENEWGGDIQTFTVSAFTEGGAVLIPPGGWFVVAQNGQFDINGGVPVDYTLGSAFHLGPSGHLRLRAASGTLVEDFTWSSSFPQTPGRSMNLAASVVDTPLNDQPQYWCDSSGSVRLLGGDFGTPGQPNETCGLTGP